MTATMEPSVVEVGVSRTGTDVRTDPHNLSADKFAEFIAGIGIKVLRDTREMKTFMGEFFKLLVWLAKFTIARTDRIKDVYLTDADGAILFLVVRSDVEHNEEIAEDLAELDLGAHEIFKTFRFESLDLPRGGSIEPFMDAGYLLKFVGWSQLK